MTANEIQKYNKYTIPQLLKKATKVFNAFIRKRDEDQGCISCGSYGNLQAGHYYSAGHYPILAFNENNCNFQCVRCNMYLSGNLLEYRKNLIKKIGIAEVEKLDQIVARVKRTGYKHDRFKLIEIILKYL